MTVVGDASSVPLSYAEEIFLVIREAVRNAITHAQPKHVGVAIAVGEFDLRVDIRDDGSGFDTLALASDQSHVGLTSMRERIDLLGGKLVLTSDPTYGTTVSIAIPIPYKVVPQIAPDQRLTG